MAGNEFSGKCGRGTGWHLDLCCSACPRTNTSKDWTQRSRQGRKITVWMWLVPAKLLQLCTTLWPHGLQPHRLLCPRDSAGKNAGVGCHALLQGIFPTQGSDLSLLCLLHRQAGSLPLESRGRHVDVQAGQITNETQRDQKSPTAILKSRKQKQGVRSKTGHWECPLNTAPPKGRWTPRPCCQPAPGHTPCPHPIWGTSSPLPSKQVGKGSCCRFSSLPLE